MPSNKPIHLIASLGLAFLGLSILIDSALALPAEGKVVLTQQNSASGPQTKITIGIATSSEATVFTVDNPPRIVADITKTKVRKNETISVKNSKSISQIRLGSHPDKARVVVDLIGSTAPVYTWRSVEGALIIIVNDPGPSSVSTVKEKPTPLPKPTKPEKDQKHPAQPGNTPLRTLGDLEKNRTPMVTPIIVAAPEPEVPTETPTPPAPTQSPTLSPTEVHTTLQISPKPEPTVEEQPTKHEAESIENTPAPTPTAPPKLHETPDHLPTPVESVAPKTLGDLLPTPTPPSIPSLTPSPKVEPVTQPITSPSYSKKVEAQASSAPDTLVKDETAPTVAPTSLPANSRPVEHPQASVQTWVLREIVFDYLQPGRVPLLKLMVSRPKAQVQTTKVDPKTYKLSISDCSLAGQFLALPQFPPADFVGFSLVSAKQDSGICEITIVVEPTVTIGTFVRNAEIWIKRL